MLGYGLMIMLSRRRQHEYVIDEQSWSNGLEISSVLHQDADSRNGVQCQSQYFRPLLIVNVKGNINDTLLAVSQ
jgi:hypothetical protein